MKDKTEQITLSTLSPFSHASLQVWQQKLAVEGIDGGDIGEDVLHHLQRERAFSCLVHQLDTKLLHNNRPRRRVSVNIKLFRVVFGMVSRLNSIAFKENIV